MEKRGKLQQRIYTAFTVMALIGLNACSPTREIIQWQGEYADSSGTRSMESAVVGDERDACPEKFGDKSLVYNIDFNIRDTRIRLFPKCEVYHVSIPDPHPQPLPTLAPPP